MNSLMEAKEFDKLKIVKSTHKEDSRRYTQTKCPQSRNANNVAAAIPQDNALPVRKDAQTAAKLTTSEWYAEAGEPNQ